jgi:hypothetical protein
VADLDRSGFGRNVEITHDAGRAIVGQEPDRIEDRIEGGGRIGKPAPAGGLVRERAIGQIVPDRLRARAFVTGAVEPVAMPIGIPMRTERVGLRVVGTGRVSSMSKPQPVLSIHAEIGGASESNGARIDIRNSNAPSALV